MSKILPDIKLSEDEYISMKKCSAYHGSEGCVIRDGDYAIKIFKNNFGKKDTCHEKIELTRENKFCKIKTLFRYGNLFDNEFYPLATYSYEGKFVGFHGPWLPYSSMNFSTLNMREKIFYLKKIRQKLESFHEIGIVYGDIKDDNIFIDTSSKKVTFVDIDNMKIGAYPMDLMSNSAKNFIANYGKVDKKLDSYMMNLLTIDLLQHHSGWYDEIIANLQLGFVPQKLDIPQNKKLIYEMGHVGQSYCGGYLIDHVR